MASVAVVATVAKQGQGSHQNHGHGPTTHCGCDRVLQSSSSVVDKGKARLCLGLGCPAEVLLRYTYVCNALRSVQLRLRCHACTKAPPA